jgi:fimbrial isopeptide formation D2 family protein
MAARYYIAFLLLCLAPALAQTLGGTVIVNEATADYSVLGLDTTTTSNGVTSQVPNLCTFVLTPNGSLASPARTVDAVPGTTVYLPYTLEYTGNVATTLQLATVLEASSTLAPDTLSLFLDSNNNQSIDAGENEVTSLTLSVGSSASLVVAVTLQAGYSSGGTIDLNLRANCDGETTFDEDNLSRVNVLQGGVTGLTKISVPPSNTQVSPGAEITYTVGFTVNQIALDNVVLSDVLDEALGGPTALSVTVNGNTRAVSFSAASRTVTAALGTLQPDDTVALTLTTNVLPSTPGAVVIDNTATLTFSGALSGTLTTNTVTHVTPSICAVVIQPNGSLTSPAFTEAASPGETVVLPYTLTNAGNITNDFLLETALSNNAFTPNLSLYLDTNDNGLVDAAEERVTRVDDLPSGDTVTLLLVIEVPNNATLSGDAFVNLSGRCARDTTIADDDNISEISVPFGGITSLLKTANPAENTTLYPGAALSYFVSFKANGRDLSNVVVTDVLDERLEVPLGFTNGELRDAETGLTTPVIARYDAATRTVVWQLASVPAGMNVRLEVVTSVKAEVQPKNGDVISNTARYSSSDNPGTSTNTVTHPLNQLEILLQKTASPEQVFVGDTLTYTLTVINPEDSIALRELVLTDTLPNELRYQSGTARVKLPGAEEQTLEPTMDGQKLTWTLPGLNAGEQIIVRLGTEVLAAATQVEELVNTAEVVASDANGRAVADAAAEAATLVDKGLFTAPAVLLGTVFEDLNGNAIYDEGSDLPASGVRVYLTDGRSVVSDELGRYTFLELRAGIDVVKVDMTTLPARLLAETKSESRPGLWRVRLEEGLITRQDVPLLPPGARIAVRQALNVVMGPVRLQKYVEVSGAGTKVVLELTSRETLKGLVVQEVLPQGVSIVGEIVSDDVNLVTDGLRFTFGDVSANYHAVIEYSVQPNDMTATDLLLAPTLSWQVRP